MVDQEDEFTSVFSMFSKWLEENKLIPPMLQNTSSQEKTFTYVTCGDWDLNTMLPKQCNTSQIELPSHFQHWINVKESFARSIKGNYPRTLSQMLNELGLVFEGRQHSGIDDVHNIVRVVQALAKDRHFIFENTS